MIEIELTPIEHRLILALREMGSLQGETQFCIGEILADRMFASRRDPHDPAVIGPVEREARKLAATAHLLAPYTPEGPQPAEAEHINPAKAPAKRKPKKERICINPECGKSFTVGKKSGRAKFCPDCRKNLSLYKKKRYAAESAVRVAEKPPETSIATSTRADSGRVLHGGQGYNWPVNSWPCLRCGEAMKPANPDDHICAICTASKTKRGKKK